MTEKLLSVVPEMAVNVSGSLDGKYVVVNSADPLQDADFDLYDVDCMKDGCIEYGRPHLHRLLVQKVDRKPWKNCALGRCLRWLDAFSGRSRHTPLVLDKGTCPALVFAGIDLSCMQAQEHDPQWPLRPVAVVERIGPTLQAFMCWGEQRSLGRDLGVVVGIGLVRALAAVHRAGYVHRLVTPFSVALRSSPQLHTLHDVVHSIVLTDFSLAMAWPLPPRAYVPFVGSVRYSSVRAHLGGEQGPSDDIVSVIFIVAECIAGRLPWRAVRNKNDAKQRKIAFPQSKAFQMLPKQVRRLYAQMLNTLAQTPIDHDAIIAQLHSALTQQLTAVVPFLPNVNL